MDVKWLAKPENHDYQAAEDYLSLLWPAETAGAVAAQLREHSKRKLQHRKAKDLLRAAGAGHDVLPKSNKHVAADLKKIEQGKALSPVLLVVDVRFGRLIIADGYHRVCATYHTDEDADIPCVMV